MTAPTYLDDVESMNERLREVSSEAADLRAQLNTVVTNAANELEEGVRRQVASLSSQLNLVERQRDQRANEVETLGTELRSLREALEYEKTAHRGDVKLIGDTLINATEDDPDNNVYDDNVDTLNRRLSVELPLRQRRYEVSINVQVRLTVEATDEDGAKDATRDDIRGIERLIDGYQTDTAIDVTSSVDDDYSWDVERTDNDY